MAGSITSESRLPLRPACHFTAPAPPIRAAHGSAQLEPEWGACQDQVQPFPGPLEVEVARRGQEL